MHVAAPRSILFRSVFRGRVIYATPAWLLEEAADHVVIGLVAGSETAQLADGRSVQLERLANGTERLEPTPWHTTHCVWLMPFDVAYAIGHFWNAATGEFLGHYVNLQAPLRRTTLGFDAMDHVLDIVVDADGRWHWKDEDELAEAVRLGIFSTDEAIVIRAEGERVVAQLDDLLPTGWETWWPDPTWHTLRLPADWRHVDR